MKVMQKVLIGMTIVIGMMSLSYFVFTPYYTKQNLEAYAKAVREENAIQWSNQLSFYYQMNQNSWEGVERFLYALAQRDREPGWLQKVTIYDLNRRSILSMGEIEQEQEPIRVSIRVQNRQVGVLEIYSRYPKGLVEIERTFLQSMRKGTLISILFTSLVALLLSIWFARFITKPLRSMIRSMNQIKEGDLQAKMQIFTSDEFGEVGDTFNIMTEQLYRTEQARSHLVGDVAHELRTPLTIIQGQLELIQQGVKEATPETLLPIQDEVSRLTILVQDLHQLSLAEVGQLPLKKSKVDVRFLLQNLIQMYRVEAEEREIEMEFVDQTNGEKIFCLLDANRITQVFVNLLVNALHYTDVHGKVSICLTLTEDAIQVILTDTGSGISEEHLPYLFNRFYRADEDRSRNKGGTGLGLAIAKEFVEAHEGTITVKSKVGKGTSFIVKLPLGN